MPAFEAAGDAGTRSAVLDPSGVTQPDERLSQGCRRDYRAVPGDVTSPGSCGPHLMKTCEEIRSM